LGRRVTPSHHLQLLLKFADQESLQIQMGCSVAEGRLLQLGGHIA